MEQPATFICSACGHRNSFSVIDNLRIQLDACKKERDVAIAKLARIVAIVSEGPK